MATIQVKGMSCDHCRKAVTEAVENIDGTVNVQVDLDQGTASYDGEADQEAIKAAIRDAGFDVD